MNERTKGILILLLVIIALAIAAYYSTGDRMTIRNLLEGTSPTQNEGKETGDVATTTEEGKTSGTEREKIEEDTVQYKINAAYPTTGVGYDEVSEYIRGAMKEFKKKATRPVMEVPTVKQYLFKNMFEKYVTENYVSYKVITYIYQGGANGVELVKTFVFTKGGEQLTLDTFIPSDKQDVVIQEVKAEIRKVNNVSEDEELQFNVSYGDFANFYITEESLVIAFDEYSVAPGAAGVVEVWVDRNLLR